MFLFGEVGFCGGDSLEGGKTSPYSTTRQRLPLRGAPAARRVKGGPWGRNQHPATLQSPSVTASLKGSHPLRLLFWPRRGQCGGRRKSVKKNAALLHFLAFSLTDHLFGVPRGERLAAHNERRQFAAQTRSCGYSPRWGEHCSLPSFAALNCGPLLATPQSPRPGFAASEQRDFFRFLFWSQKRKA